MLPQKPTITQVLRQNASPQLTAEMIAKINSIFPVVELHYPYLPPGQLFLIPIPADIEGRYKAIPWKSRYSPYYDIFSIWDTESTRRIHEKQPDFGIFPGKPDNTQWHWDGENVFLTYQITVVNCHAEAWKEVIFFPHVRYHEENPIEGYRLFSPQIIRLIIDLAALSNKVLTRYAAKKTPVNIFLGSHWASMEMSSLQDRDRFDKHSLLILGGGVVSKGPIEGVINIDDKRRKYPFKLYLNDSITLMAKNTALEEMVRPYGMVKPPIQDKSRMDLELKNNPVRFIEYATGDTQKALVVFTEYAATIEKAFELTDTIPLTLGSTAARAIGKFYGDIPTRLCLKRNRKKEWIPDKDRYTFEPIAKEGYLGAMNRAYRRGHHKGIILDLDLSSAYPSTYPMLYCLDWSKPPRIETDQRPFAERLKNPRIDPHNYTSIYSFIKGDFIFPEGTQFPTLPIRDELHGLIYPLSSFDNEYGESLIWMPSPEIELALSHGVTIIPQVAVQFPTTNELLLAEFTKLLVKLRQQYTDKDDPLNKMAKIIGLAIYGKMGQGTSERLSMDEVFQYPEVYNGDDRETVPYSSITLPHASAMITSIIRAALNICIIEETKAGGKVLEATTDGNKVVLPYSTLTPDVQIERFMEDVNNRIDTYPLIKRLHQARQLIGLEKTPLLEVKKYKLSSGEFTNYATEAYIWKTRTNWIGFKGETLYEARTGYRRDHKRSDYIPTKRLIELTDNVEPHFIRESHLTTYKDIRTGKAKDVITVIREKRFNIAYDWKDILHEDGTTSPFPTIHAYRRYRKVIDILGPRATYQEVHNTLSLGTTMTKSPVRTSHSKRQRYEIALRMSKVLIHKDMAIPGYRKPRSVSWHDAASILEIDRHRFQQLKDDPILSSDWQPDEQGLLLIKRLKLY